MKTEETVQKMPTGRLVMKGGRGSQPITGQVLPVKMVKAKLLSTKGQVVEGYFLVDAEEVRFVDSRSLTRPAQPWAAAAIRTKLREAEEAAVTGGGATQITGSEG